METMRSGGTPKSSNQGYYGGEIPFLSISDITKSGKYIDLTEKTITQEGLDSCSAWVVPKYSLILAMYASYGKVCINTVPMATSQALLAMIPKPGSSLEFFYQYGEKMATIGFWDAYVKSGTQPNLSKGTIEKTKIFIPSVDEQQKIADFFFAMDKKIALAERKNLKLNELKECLLNQIISTQDRPMVELGSLANIKDGARVPNEYWKSEGVPYIRAKDLNDGMANVELYLTHEKYEEYRSKTGAPVSGDLIFVTGGNIGLSMFKSDNSPLYVQGGAILTVKTSESKLLDGKFLHYYLQTNACKRYIETHSVGGTIKHFTVAPSLKLPIPLIPIDEQIKIASFFSKLDEKISFSKAKLDMLRRLKQALLQQMFV